MSAEIIVFKPGFPKNCPYSPFRKALMAVLILSEFQVEEIELIIKIWLARGLVSADEAEALNVFFEPNLEEKYGANKKT